MKVGEYMKLRLTNEQFKKWSWNLVKFTAPALAVFFSLLAKGVPFSKAWPVLVCAGWGLLADYLKKLK